MVWLVMIVAVLASLYPLLDVVRPETAIQLQVRSTETHDDWRGGVGRWFQRALQIDPSTAASPDRGSRRRVRVLGLVLLAGIWLIALGLIAATA